MSFMNHENFHEPNFYLKSFLESSWKNKKMSDIFHSQKSFPHWASLMIDLWFPIKKKLPSRNENFSFELWWPPKKEKFALISSISIH